MKGPHKTNRQTDKQTNRQTDEQTNRQTDEQTNTTNDIDRPTDMTCKRLQTGP